jgi:N utilization substance protein B
MEEVTNNPVIATSRRDFRSLVIQLLYVMESFDYTVSLESVIHNFNRGYEMDIPIDGEVAVMAQSIIDTREALDETVTPLLANWRLERLGTCTRLVLRVALWELENTDTHATIIINEAIELAKAFSEKDAYKFVNGILDEAVKKMEKHKKYDYKDLSALK